MTRLLSEMLGAVEPQFSLSMKDLERASGQPSTDIKLTTEVLQRTHAKLRLLGLDPLDTTPEELYQALGERMGRDDELVRHALHLNNDASTNEVISAVTQYAQRAVREDHATFALKPSVAKRLLKKNPPKKALKKLHYRSVDSLLKHEAVQHIYIAAFAYETSAWRKKLLDHYAKLRPSDFETRSIEITTPQTSRWDEVAEELTSTQKHMVFVTKELGAVVVLPAKRSLPGTALTTLMLTLNAVNDVMSAGSYLKLQQVRPDFGQLVRFLVSGEQLTGAMLAKQHVPWRVVHQFYSRHVGAMSSSVFDMHVQETELRWSHPEAILAELHPDLAFWQDTAYTGFVHGASCVSLNVLDVAINFCNQLPYAERAVQFLRRSLWHECMLRYLDIENIERALASELLPRLETVPIISDTPIEDENSPAPAID